VRVLLTDHPLGVSPGGDGPPHTWLELPDAATTSVVAAYRLRFSLPTGATARVHVSADERYTLYLDGHQMGRGPERGDAHIWFYDTYDLALDAGEHLLLAQVWSLGHLAPLAQVSAAPGFLLAAEPPFATLLNTGAAVWETRILEGYNFALPEQNVATPWFVGPNQTTDAAQVDWLAEGGHGVGWQPGRARREETLLPFGIAPAHTLRPAMLPGQLDARRHAGTVRFAAHDGWTSPFSAPVDAEDHLSGEARSWQATVDGRGPGEVPPHTRRRVILDFGEYYCAYPRLITSGGQGATLTLCWAEALYLDAAGHAKGNRNEVVGRHFVAASRDTYLPDGGAGRSFGSLWWRAGRYLQLLIETADEPLRIEQLALWETRYPLEMESRFQSDDERLGRMLPIALRGLQMCAHETYMDCPYYEQMMYVGDTRLECLTTYAISRDDRLPRKALTMFDLSRLPNGLTQARYPGRDVQIIPPFSLWWATMIHDYALWRGDRAFVVGLLPGVRAVLDAYLSHITAEGVVAGPDGWNFADWVPHWPIGIPPGAALGVSALLNWQLVYTLVRAAELETWTGEPELAGRFARHARQMGGRLVDLFWDEGRGLFADDASRESYSEHTQCLALLSGVLDKGRAARLGHGLLADPGLVRTTIYFTHYLFEAYRMLGAGEALFNRLGLWFALPEQGFKTTPEMPEPTRSDCHAWGAHPIYHCFATLLGIRPTEFGFDTLEIAPLLGPPRHLSGTLVHPRGVVEADLRLTDSALEGTITLPEGVTGVLRYAGHRQALAPGPRAIRLQGE